MTRAETSDTRTAVVTGGAGFVGSHLCERLLKSGFTVISLDNYRYGNEKNHVQGVSYRRGDTRDIVELVPENPDLLFHLGEYARVAASINEPELTFESNLTGTSRVLEFWRSRRCKMIYAGSSALFSDNGSQLSPYTWSKMANCDLINNYARWYDLQFTIVYLSNVYGPRERTLQEHGTLIETWRQSFLADRPLVIRGAGTQVRHFTDVRDAVTGMILAAEKGAGDGYQIASRDRHSVLEVSQIFGGDVEHVPASPANRMDSEANTSKIKDLGWRQVYTLRQYVDNIKHSKSLQSNEIASPHDDASPR
ncbi:MAG: UDP-glucose 4-epimerase [Sphingomonadales bacterium]|jgi:UDP-glucose 4-epimerase|nr:UDP-glucose 4-epimerase [Sphingomonadales bacterium]